MKEFMDIVNVASMFARHAIKNYHKKMKRYLLNLIFRICGKYLPMIGTNKKRNSSNNGR
jgi:hypothetical protein